MSLTSLTRTTLLRTSLLARSSPLIHSRPSPILASSPFRRSFASAPPPSPSSPPLASTATPTPEAVSNPPPNTALPPQASEPEKHPNAKVFSPEGTKSYRELLLFFSETLTRAFNTPYVAPKVKDQYQFKTTAEHQASLIRPGMQIMQDPGTFVMIEKIREAGQAEGMELEAINQHILSILDTITPVPEETVFTDAQRIAEAEAELKVAVDMLRDLKDGNRAFLEKTTPWKINTQLPFGLGEKLNNRALFKRNNQDARVNRVMSRIMDCGYEGGRDPREMSLLLKHGYFPPGQPPTLTIDQVKAADAEWDDGSPSPVEHRGAVDGPTALRQFYNQSKSYDKK